MNVQRLATVLVAALALTAVVAAIQQRGRLTALEREFVALTEPDPAGNPPATPTSPKSAQAGEKRELMRLRSELTRLRQRERDLEVVRTENAVLHQRIAASSSKATAPGGGAWIRRKEARYGGGLTPEAALESLFWAVEHRDTNVLLGLIRAESRERVREGLDREGEGNLWKELGIVPGFSIVGRHEEDEQTVVLQVEFIPGEAPTGVTAVRVDDEWKLAF